MKRKAAVAGYFYPGQREELKRMISGMVDPRAKKEKALCVVSPHAGYIYSGPVAGAVFSSVEIPETLVILGPNHRSLYPSFALMDEGSWETPLGEVPLAKDLAQRLLELSSLFEVDERAHREEHSLEVQVPFIQHFRSDFSLVPLCISPAASYEELEEVGNALASAIKAYDRKVLIVASTDMSHYVTQEEAKSKDFLAIEKILELDVSGLYQVVHKEKISMCGVLPTTVGIIASKALGAQKAELIKYQTSGDTSGNYLEVVGYAGMRIS